MYKKGIRRYPDVPLQPVVLREMRVRCGKWSITGLRVNRHLQPFDQMTPHAHPHGQLLLYLRGRGIQRVGSKSYPVSAGSVFFVPAGMTHGFEETGPRRAICLVADWRGDSPSLAQVDEGWTWGWRERRCKSFPFVWLPVIPKGPKETRPTA
ncbi:MAG: cupin domain-containing protein [Verrucomicrobia bacterium]|nr:cupin domain-containing protein [Verrucomicrobiota bacterium]